MKIVEYVRKKDNKTYYQGYINYMDTNHSFLSFDSALIASL